jgi:CheY-like chemotaxis protein
MRKSSTSNLVALVLMLVLAGCKGKPLRVNIAPGYSGEIIIDCGTSNDDYQPIEVGSTGYVAQGTCPSKHTELLISKDGKTVTAGGPITWATTGDGIPVSIHFAIR